MALDADDIDAFLDPDMPGYVTTVLWTPVAGPGGSFSARFKAVSSSILGGMVSAAEPALMFATVDAPELSSGDSVRVDGIDYDVRDVLPFCDGKITRALMRPTP
jgi:hypothetical protein